MTTLYVYTNPELNPPKILLVNADSEQGANSEISAAGKGTQSWECIGSFEEDAPGIEYKISPRSLDQRKGQGKVAEFEYIGDV